MRHVEKNSLWRCSCRESLDGRRRRRGRKRWRRTRRAADAGPCGSSTSRRKSCARLPSRLHYYSRHLIQSHFINDTMIWTTNISSSSSSGILLLRRRRWQKSSGREKEKKKKRGGRKRYPFDRWRGWVSARGRRCARERCRIRKSTWASKIASRLASGAASSRSASSSPRALHVGRQKKRDKIQRLFVGRPKHATRSNPATHGISPDRRKDDDGIEPQYGRV